MTTDCTALPRVHLALHNQQQRHSQPPPFQFCSRVYFHRYCILLRANNNNNNNNDDSSDNPSNRSAMPRGIRHSMHAGVSSMQVSSSGEGTAGHSAAGLVASLHQLTGRSMQSYDDPIAMMSASLSCWAT